VKTHDSDDDADLRLDFKSTSEWWDTKIDDKPKKDQKRINGRFLSVL
jgi:hypothetical protein